MADVAGIGRSRHARKTAGNRAAVAAGEELPLAQSEKRELVDSDEKKFRALVLVDIRFGLAVAEARGRAVLPFHHVLRFVERFVKLARNVAAEIEQQRLLEFGKGAAKQQRVMKPGVSLACRIASISSAFDLPGPAAPPKSRYFAGEA